MGGEAASWTEIRETRFLRTRFTTPLWSVLQSVIVIYGLLASGYVVAWRLAGEDWRWVAFLNNFIPWGALIAAVLGVLGLLSRLRLLLAGMQIPLLAVFALVYGDLLLPPPTIDKPAGTDLTVATFNIHSEGSDPETILRTIKGMDADMIAVQELGPEHAALFSTDLHDKYPYQLLFASRDSHGVGLLSRYPITDYSVFHTHHKYVRHVRVIVQIEDTPVIVYITHPHSPYNMFTRYNDTQRRHEMADLRERLQADSGPLLVLCDCNMTQGGDDYHKLDRMLDDFFREVGWGMGFTFPAKSFRQTGYLPPMVRIDYVWHNDAFTAYDAYVGSSGGTSDHRPMVARLVLKEMSAAG